MDSEGWGHDSLKGAVSSLGLVSGSTSQTVSSIQQVRTQTLICRVSQNHIHTVYTRCFGLGNHQIYVVFIRIYTVLANHTRMQHCTAKI